MRFYQQIPIFQPCLLLLQPLCTVPNSSIQFLLTFTPFPPTMFNALRTFSSVACDASPAYSTTANAPTSPALSDMQSSSIQSTPPSLLFNLQAQVEDQRHLLSPLPDLKDLRPVSDLFLDHPYKKAPFSKQVTANAMAQCKPPSAAIHNFVAEQLLAITSASDEEWIVPSVSEPNGWHHPSAKPFNDQAHLPSHQPYDSEV